MQELPPHELAPEASLEAEVGLAVEKVPLGHIHRKGAASILDDLAADS